jgi:hypothetical protein
MSKRGVTFHEIKEAKNNLALLERPGQRTTKNLMRNQIPSANFGSQWGISKQGYNLNPLPNNIAAQIINPNGQEPQRREFNEPYVIPRPKGWYSPLGRGNIATVYSTNNLASLIPEEHQRGYFAMPEVLSLLTPKATNGMPVPRPRTAARHRKEDKLRTAANANELLRNINRTVRSRRRKNKTRRNR